MLPFHEGNQLTVGEFIPCFYAKTFFDRIFQSAGYRYDWTTLSDMGIEFDKLLIPYNGDGYNNKEQDKIVTEDTNLSLTSIGYNASSPTTPPNTYTYQLPEVVDVSNQYNPATGEYTPNQIYQGENSLKCVVNFKGTYCIGNPFNVPIILQSTDSANDYVNEYVLTIRAMNPLTVGFYDVFSVKLPNLTTILANSNLTYDIDTTFEFNIVGTQSNPLVTFELQLIGYEIELYSDSAWRNGTAEFSTVQRMLNHDIRVEVFPANNNVYSGADIDMNQYIPKKIKQSDYIKSIFQMFNLYADLDSNDSKLIILNTRDDYYDNGLVKDWTKKLAKNLEINTQFLPDVSSKRYLLTYKNDETEANVIYKNNVNEIYGQQEYIFDSEFVRETQTNEIIFSPSPFTINQIGQAVNYIQGKKPKTGIRILYDGGLQPCGVWYVNDFYDYDGVLLTTYPQIIHLNDYSLPSYDINFGVCDFYFTPQISFTRNNLYNLHWRRTLGQINSGKLVTAYFNLNELDINTLRLNDKIQVGNTLFNINKIIDYNANSEQLTKVELMTIDADVLLTPFDNRTPSQLSGADFSITIPRSTNINPNESEVIGNYNNVSDGYVSGNENNVSGTNVIVLGDANIDKGRNTLIVGQGITNEGFSNVAIVGSDKDPRFNDSVTTKVIDTELVYVEDTLTTLAHGTRTTDATTTTIYSFTPENGVYIVEAKVTGYRLSNGDSIGIDIFAVFKVIAGVVTQVSTTDTVRKSNFIPSVTATINTDGTIIRVRVTGLAGATIDWNTNIQTFK
jgi:hypothetical protein